MNNRTGIIIILIACCFSCRQVYVTPVKSLQDQLLVVEANLTPDFAIINLSRTVNLNDTLNNKPENNAIVTVEGKDNLIRSMASLGNGTYYAATLNLTLNAEYMLRIKTTTGKEYLSDYITTINTPQIDSVSWEQDSKGIQINVNTKDVTNSVNYFRWRYTETWEIRSLYYSNLIYENNSLRFRNFPAEDVSICWRDVASAKILLANSAKLQSSIISKAPIQFIPRGDKRLHDRYSILVEQIALDKNAYNFFEILKKNTEDIGSFFSPQPAELKGNIHCISNPDELVIGYVTSSVPSTKRIFISYNQLFEWPKINNCIDIKVPNNPDSIRIAASNLLPVAFLGSPPNQYIFASAQCVDCRTNGGQTIRPSYW